MKLSNRLILLVLVILITTTINSQVVFEPNYSLKSPETINLISFEIKQNSTIVNFSITNLVKDGYYCADKNTFITTDKGVRFRLSDVIGLPNCPEVHRFNSVGEKLYFSLIFPPIDPKTQWFDIIEECDDNCFSILGITTNENLNKRVNSCFDFFESGQVREAAEMFEAILPELEISKHGLTGSIYMNLIIIYKSLGDKKESYYRDKLKNSDIPHRDKIIEGLKRL